MTIDRIVFLRNCEDRGIEDYGRLLGLTNGTAIYDRLKQFFRSADDRFNSGLFHFRNDDDYSEPPDELTPRLKIGDKPVKEILTSLYFPKSPYQFDALPVEILGQVYEQFLGRVIRLTASHQARVEDKPEVKKAGGVYYTPKYIVDYIVEHTVGALLNPSPGPSPKRGGKPDLLPSPPASGGEGLGVRGDGASQTLTPIPSPAKPGEGRTTPKQAAKLRILDPACGSGSFLLGAYQYLLDWHRDWYVANEPDKHTKEIYRSKSGDWRLTTAE